MAKNPLDYDKRNRAKRNAAAKKYRENNRDKIKAAHRKKLYGIEADEVQAKSKAQGGLCKVCGIAPATDVDHDHETGKVRSLLCGSCNRALGLLRDDVTILLSAVQYLYFWKVNNASVTY